MARRSSVRKRSGNRVLYKYPEIYTVLKAFWAQYEFGEPPFSRWFAVHHLSKGLDYWRGEYMNLQLPRYTNWIDMDGIEKIQCSWVVEQYVSTSFLSYSILHFTNVTRFCVNVYHCNQVNVTYNYTLTCLLFILSLVIMALLLY